MICDTVPLGSELLSSKNKSVSWQRRHEAREAIKHLRVLGHRPDSVTLRVSEQCMLTSVFRRAAKALAPGKTATLLRPVTSVSSNPSLQSLAHAS